jgi:hypothetical protein
MRNLDIRIVLRVAMIGEGNEIARAAKHAEAEAAI